MEALKNGALTLQWTMLVACIGLAIQTLEDLTRFNVYTDTGILSWKITQAQFSWSFSKLKGRVLDFILNESAFKALLIIRLFTIATVICTAILGGNRVIFASTSFIILLSLIAHSLRTIYGLDGTHQLYIVIFAGTCIASSFPEESIAFKSAIGFIALQTVISYFSSGVHKLRSVIWRSGDAVVGIFSARMYGNRWVYLILQKFGLLAFVLSWSIIVFEISFVFVFIGEPKLTIFMLLSGIAFHLSTAVFMGLNNFLFAFLSTYPAIIYSVYTLK